MKHGVKRMLCALCCLSVLAAQTACTTHNEPVSEKPVLYLYPEEETEVTVTLDLDGVLTSAYPDYGEGWSVTAAPDGTLTDGNGREFYCLFWEGAVETEYDFSAGFCVAGEDTAAFLEEALASLGLTAREVNEFLIYWLPRMEDHPYNLIAFQTDSYTSAAGLTISPSPDTLIRVFMAWKGLEQQVEIPAQQLEAVERKGFTAVEWGGAEIL